jgi:hypothetical protein
MMSLTTTDFRAHHPVDHVELLASTNEWNFDRSGLDEILLSAEGQFANYSVSFTWMAEMEALHIACSFDMPLPLSRQAEAYKLLQKVNELMWIGHFDLWPSEGVAMFRHALMLAGGLEPTQVQCEALLLAAIKACNTYYQAFQFVVISGKTAQEALDCALFETIGNA